MFVDRQAQRSSMHARHLNEQLVRVLKTIGYDVGFQKGQGQYLYDRDGARYLDLLSGFGVFAIGRNHPALRQALKSVLDADLPNLVQLDVSTLAGVLAERLLKYVPWLDKVFFANSGAETVEAAIKFARGATGRPGIVYCAHAFHGLSYGALSLTDDPNFRAGFEPLLPGCTSIPFNDLAALEQALSSRQVAAIVEPIRARASICPPIIPARRCSTTNTAPIADNQTGIGCTDASSRSSTEMPNPTWCWRALSGGHVPVGAFNRKSIFDKIFNQMDRAVVHGSTFAKNDLAMAAGIATLEVMKAEKLVEQAAKRGAELAAGADPDGAGLRIDEGSPRQGTDDRRRVRSAEIAAAEGFLESAGDREQGPVLPAHHGAAVQGSQDPDAGLRPRQPHHQAVAAADHHAGRLHLDRDVIRFRYCRQPQGPRRDLVARQDAGRQRGAEVGVGCRRCEEPMGRANACPMTGSARCVNLEGDSDAHSGFGDFDNRNGFDGNAGSCPDL
jgi:ornithine--oxo-acid transaminase